MSEPQPDTRFFSKPNIFAMFVGTGLFVVTYLFCALFSGQYYSGVVFGLTPLFSSIVVAILTPSRSRIFGTCFFSLLVNLLLSPFILLEGLFCVVMAAPIFAAVTALAAVVVWAIRGATEGKERKAISPPTMLLLFLIAALVAGCIWDEIVLRNGAPIETVSTVVEIDSTRGELWKRLTFDRPSNAKVPLWLRLWVAQPERYAFGETGVGARRETDFGSPHYGDDPDALRNKLVYNVTEWREDEAATFACQENHSRMRRWVDLIDTRVEFTDLSATGTSGAVKTRVVLTTRYRRKIGPSAYFTPFLNLAVRGMHGMLAEEIGAVMP